MSSGSNTALTPGIASAALMSTLRMRACGNGLRKEPGVQHPFGAVILGILRLPGDFRHEIRGAVVLADQLGFSHLMSLRI